MSDGLLTVALRTIMLFEGGEGPHGWMIGGKKWSIGITDVLSNLYRRTLVGGERLVGRRHRAHPRKSGRNYILDPRGVRMLTPEDHSV